MHWHGPAGFAVRGGQVGESKGPRQRNALIINFSEWVTGNQYTALPTMCLDRIIAHKTYYFYLALPLKPVSSENVGHPKLMNSSVALFFWSTN